MGNTPAPAFILFIAAVAATAACAPEGSGHFEAAGVLAHPACFEKVFPLEAEFRTAARRPDSVGIFLQSGDGVFADVDLLYMEVYQPQYVRAHIGEAIPLGLPTEFEPVVLAELSVGQSCPDLLESFYVTGAVIFDEFDYSAGGVITGQLLDGAVWKTRSGEKVIESITGQWNFVVREGRPWEAFHSPERIDSADGID